MLIIFAFMLLIVSAMLCIIKRNKETLLVFCLVISLNLFVFSMTMFIAKKGGVAGNLELFLFLSKFIMMKLRYAAVTLNGLGYIMCIGKYLFPLFFILLCISYSMVTFIRNNKKIIFLVFILPCLSLIIYFPAVIKKIFSTYGDNGIKIIINISFVWTFLYIILGIVFLIIEFVSITIKFYKIQFFQKLCFLLMLALLYVTFLIQNPVQVYLFYRSEYVSSLSLWFLVPNVNVYKYLIIIIANFIFGFFGCIALVSYTQVNYKEKRVEVVLKRHFAIAGKGVSVFVHSVKNQLLANKVIYKRLTAMQEKGDIENQEVWSYIKRLEATNQAMLTRLEELYSSVRSKGLYLSPIKLRDILDDSVEKLNLKYSNALVNIECNDNIMVLADKPQMSEAIYNLLVNAWEAVLDIEKTTPVEIIVHEERMYTVVEVKDNGKGMEKAILSKIFEPFYSCKNSNYNWGMGLYHVRTIVKNHFGRIRVESKLGQGTSFFIMLPKY